MLSEILETRFMIKDSLKNAKSNKFLKRQLEAKQLGLKYIANVTYGYTSANFSGRMPCVEIADAIVSTGRAILEKTIQHINGHKPWGARVVYGDTDSVFVLVKNASMDRAFAVGHEIAAAITALNPKPMKLKFEKVYRPCVLLTKKRYVGYKYEHVDEREGVLDAKGIETIRRDTCPIVSKMMDKCLRYIKYRSPLTCDVGFSSQRRP